MPKKDALKGRVSHRLYKKLILSCRSEADEDEEEEEEYEYEDDVDGPNQPHHGRIVFEEPNGNKQFTGILFSDGRPIFRVQEHKPGIGFLCEGLDEYDPDCFVYGMPPFSCEEDFINIEED